MGECAVVGRAILKDVRPSAYGKHVVLWRCRQICLVYKTAALPLTAVERKSLCLHDIEVNRPTYDNTERNTPGA
jgi:hypothetical protein